MKSVSRIGLSLTAIAFLLSACETTEGLGRDTQKLGKNISKSAEKNDGNNYDD